MCDCLQSAAITAGNGVRKLGLGQYCWTMKPMIWASDLVLSGYKDCSFTNKLPNRKRTRFLFFRHEKLFTNQKVLTFVSSLGSNASEFRLKEMGDEQFEMGFLQNGEEKLEESSDNDSLKREIYENGEFELLNFDEPLQEVKDEVLMDFEEKGKIEDLPNQKPRGELKGKLVSSKRKQLMKRSSIIAKQVIGIESASNLGFVSQLWVDTSTWTVLEVEVRPSLLSSETGRFLLEDVTKVGDVVFVQEENYMLNEFKAVGLETLVGYSVVTPGQKTLGKVRGYTFNINSGTVESLELDAFGFSIIPSSLVSTYALFTEDVLEVLSDIIIVHETVASRIQRLTKGFFGSNNTEKSSINLKYRYLEEESTQLVEDRRSKRKSSKRKFYPGTRDLGKDFELPMDYM